MNCLCVNTMKAPTKIVCYSRPSRDKDRHHLPEGIAVCRQGHAIWRGDHYDLASIGPHLMRRRSSVLALPDKVVHLSVRRSVRAKKKVK